MVYVPPEVHRAMRRLAIDDRRSASDVYAEAARAFLAVRGVTVEEVLGMGVSGPRGTTADLAAAMDRLGCRIEEALGRIEASTAETLESRGALPAGTTAAVAVEALLRVLGDAGDSGLTAREFSTTIQAAGIRSGTAEIARAVLRAAGLVRCKGRLWYLGVP